MLSHFRAVRLSLNLKTTRHSELLTKLNSLTIARYDEEFTFVRLNLYRNTQTIAYLSKCAGIYPASFHAILFARYVTTYSLLGSQPVEEEQFKQAVRCETTKLMQVNNASVVAQADTYQHAIRGILSTNAAASFLKDECHLYEKLDKGVDKRLMNEFNAYNRDTVPYCMPIFEQDIEFLTTVVYLRDF